MSPWHPVGSYSTFSPLPLQFSLRKRLIACGCCFLSRYSAVTDSSLLESMVLYVARTFLLSLS